jgi:hypothetical protein
VRPLFEGDVIEYDIEEISKGTELSKRQIARNFLFKLILLLSTGPVAKNVHVLTRAPRTEGDRVQPSEEDKKLAREHVEYLRRSQDQTA